MPFLILGSGIAMVDIWRRLDGRSRRVRVGSLAVIVAVAVFTIWANVGLAISPNEEWMPSQAYQFVQAQESISQLTGNPLEARVQQGASLPAWRPGNQLYIVNSCRGGLYISTGENYSTVPSQQFQRATWLSVQRGSEYLHNYRVTFDGPGPRGATMVPLVRVGTTTLSVGVGLGTVPGRVSANFSLRGPNGVQSGGANVVPGSTHTVGVVTDQALHLVQILMGGEKFVDVYVSETLVKDSPISVITHSYRSPGTLSLTTVPTVPTLCNSIRQGAPH